MIPPPRALNFQLIEVVGHGPAWASRARVDGGWIYVFQSVGSLNSCFVPDPPRDQGA